MQALEIIVCIKPIPDPSRWNRLRLDPETMMLRRDEIPSLINPLDRTAIAQAVLLREESGGNIHVLTMAPPSGEEQLREALAMGCDRAYLATDAAFAGADTLATARCLQAMIAKIGSFDLVLCGAQSLDGSTSHVGPQVAELLQIPDLTHAVKVGRADGKIRAECQRGLKIAVCECDLPLLITLNQEAVPPRLTDIRGLASAVEKQIEVLSAADLGLAPDQIGLAGSPSKMHSIFTPAVGRKGEILQGSVNETVVDLLSRLRRDKVISERS